MRFEFRVNKYRRSLETTDRREAERKARQVRAEIEAAPPRPDKRRSSLTLRNASVADLLEKRQAGISELHASRLEALWVVTLRVAGPDTPLVDIDSAWLRSYEGRRRATGKKGQTIVREFGLFKRALAWAKRKGADVVIPDPWPKVKRDPPDAKRSGKYRDPMIVRQFLAMLDQDARDEVGFIAMTGLRWAEMKRLRYDWIEPSPRNWASPALVRLPDEATKTRKARVVGVPTPALEIVDRRKSKATGPLVFSPKNYRKQRETARRALGLDSNITLRDLRHTFATLALQRTGDPTAVLRAMGHTNLSMTERYLSSPLERTAALGAAVSSVLLEDTRPLTHERTHGEKT